MPIQNPNGEMRYWFKGAPFSGVKKSTYDAGEMRYWFRGAPVALLYPASGGTTYNQSVLASCSPIASLVRQTGKPLATSTAPVATLVRQTTKPFKASTSPVATLVAIKVVLVSLQAVANAVASLVRSTGKPHQATTAPPASLIRQTAKPFASLTAPVASLTRQTGKPLKTTTAPVASLSAIKVVLLALQAATAPIASLVRMPAKPLQAVTAPAATVRRGVGKRLQALATAIASLAEVFHSGAGAIADPLFWLKPLARVRMFRPARVRNIRPMALIRLLEPERTRQLKPQARIRMILAQRGVVKKFSPTTPAGRADCTIDFTSILAGAYSPPVTVSSCVVTCAIHPTSAVPDPTAGARCDGAAIVTAGKSVTQFFKDGVAGADYILTFLATLSNGAKEPIDAVQPVRAYNDVGT
jgi:hypothetical protein